MEADLSVGIAFCDSQTAFYSIRAVTESLQTVFEALALITCSRFVRQEQGLTVVPYSAADPGWMDKVLEFLCASGRWQVGDVGDCEEADMEPLIARYLAWSTQDAQAMQRLK